MIIEIAYKMVQLNRPGAITTGGVADCEHPKNAYEEIKISQESAYRAGIRQSIAENKLIVCRATGRPLIFPNVIEGVCALLENPEKKGKIQNNGEEGRRSGG